MKECPKCNSIIAEELQQCPYCNYVFGETGEPETVSASNMEYETASDQTDEGTGGEAATEDKQEFSKSTSKNAAGKQSNRGNQPGGKGKLKTILIVVAAVLFAVLYYSRDLIMEGLVSKAVSKTQMASSTTTENMDASSQASDIDSSEDDS